MVDKEFFFQALIYMYCDTKSFVPFRDHNTDWFVCISTVQQRKISYQHYLPCLSTTSLYIWNMSTVGFNWLLKLNVLLYADNIHWLRKNKTDKDVMLDVVYRLKSKWRLCINSLKSKEVHFCQRKRKRSDHVFCIGEIVWILQHPINIFVYNSINLRNLKII